MAGISLGSYGEAYYKVHANEQYYFFTEIVLLVLFTFGSLDTTLRFLIELKYNFLLSERIEKGG